MAYQSTVLGYRTWQAVEIFWEILALDIHSKVNRFSAHSRRNPLSLGLG